MINFYLLPNLLLKSRLVGDTKVEAERVKPERRVTTQKQLEYWDEKICMRFNKDKCKHLHPE